VISFFSALTVMVSSAQRSVSSRASLATTAEWSRSRPRTPSRVR
jgi:hypothetical protein